MEYDGRTYSDFISVLAWTMGISSDQELFGSHLGLYLGDSVSVTSFSYEPFDSKLQFS